MERINGSAYSISDNLTNSVRDQMGESFWNHMVQNVLSLDDRFSVISDEHSQDTECPSDVKCGFIGISDGSRYFATEIQSTIIKEFETKYIEEYENDET